MHTNDRLRIFFRKYLHNSKKSSNFAPGFEKNYYL